MGIKLNGGADDDILEGGPGNDQLFGAGGNDKLYGHGGNDRLEGGSGNDWLYGGTGNDQMIGGSGNDVYAIESKGDTVVEQIDQGIDEVRSSIALKAAFANVENYTFTGSGAVQFTANALNNKVSGTELGDSLWGGTGNDTLAGNGGDDDLHGQAGNDLLQAGAGTDTLDGGSGNDTLVVQGLGFSQVSGGSGEDVLRFTGKNVTLDLGLYAGGAIQDIERIDLSKSGKDDLILTKAAVEAASSTSDRLIVDGNAGDVLHLDSAFVLNGSHIVDGEIYAVYQSGGAAVYVDKAIDVNRAAPKAQILLTEIDGTNGVRLDSLPHDAGAHVASAGDINGDGFADFIVGTALADPDNADRDTAAFVVFGGANLGGPVDLDALNGSNGYRLEHPTTFAFYSSVAAGDFNGDGIADFAVSAEDQTYFVFGTKDSGGPGIDLAALDGTDGFRMDVGTGIGRGHTNSVGDLNGDGFDDLVVGDYAADKAYVVFGHGGAANPVLSGAAVSGSIGFQITGGDRFGYAVSAEGDINGDGIKDLLIGATNDGPDGAAYVIFGHSGDSWISDTTQLDGTNGFKLTRSAGEPGALGQGITSLGDLNRDGFDDIMVSADSGATNYVIYGHAGGFPAAVDLSTLDESKGFAITGSSGGEAQAAGDINGDGYIDLLIGSVFDGTAQQGGVYVVYGSAGGFGNTIDVSKIDGLNGFTIAGTQDFERVGQAVSAAGDVNGDGFDDILIGDLGGNPYGSTSGSAFVIYGGDFRNDANFAGTDKDDSFAGKSGADIIIGGLGNDLLTGGGGFDTIRGGAGGDQIHVNDRGFHTVDGGGGTDTLHFDFAGAIDLGDIDGNASTSDRGKIAGIEVLDFANGKSNAITLHAADLLDLEVQNTDLGGVAGLDNVLKLDGNKGDGLTLFAADGWSAADTGSLAGYAVYSAGAVKIAVDADLTVATV
jgi:hypothetical protein